MYETALFGRLTLSAIPYTNPIIMSAVGFSAVLGALILGWITRQGHWGYLWKEWLTSVDHKRIGVMYLILAAIMLLRGFADALLMRFQQAFSEGAAHGFLPLEHYN